MKARLVATASARMQRASRQAKVATISAAAAQPSRSGWVIAVPAPMS